MGLLAREHEAGRDGGHREESKKQRERERRVNGQLVEGLTHVSNGRRGGGDGRFIGILICC